MTKKVVDLGTDSKLINFYDAADVYYGKKSGVDFTGLEDSLTVDLSEKFYGINQITVGSGQNTLPTTLKQIIL